MSPLLGVALVFGTFLFAKWLWSRRKLYALSMKVQGPFALPFVGNAIMLARMRYNGSPLHEFMETAKIFPGTYRTWYGHHLHLILVDPEDVESAFHKSVVAKSPLLTWSQVMGNGVITMTAIDNVSTWKEHKKIVNPAMGANVNKKYYDQVMRNCQSLVKQVEKLCSDKSVDFGKDLLRFCADAICESMYGVEMSFRDGNRDDILEAVETAMVSVFKKSISIWYQIAPFYNISEMGRKQKAATNIIKKFAQEIFDIKHRQLNNNQNVNCPEEAIIEQLLRAHRDGRISENQVVEEIMNLWIAASDTNGCTIQFAILMLAMHKHCQDKIFREVMDYYKGDADAIIEFHDLSKFTYTEMVIKETLRLFSPGPITVRYATEEFEFKSKNLIVPPGTNLVFLSYYTHHDPKIWINPNEFRPERFLPEEAAKRHPYSFYPFSGGPRKCGGRSYAKMLLIAAVVHLVRKYEFDSPWKLDQLPLNIDIDVRSAWGYKAKITQRKFD